MMSTEINISSKTLTSYKGDCLIVPCDVDLTNKKVNRFVTDISDTAGEELKDELTAIGYCEIGHAVIVQGYDLNVRNIVFLPCYNTFNSNDLLTVALLHQGLRNAFTLATQYGSKKIAVPLFNIGTTINKPIITISNKTIGQVSESNVEDTVIAISSNFNFKKITIFR